MLMNMTGIILANNKIQAMRELNTHRTIASVPFGGRYRMIDFVISSLVNSGVGDIGVVTRSDYYSLMDHLGSGKEWDLDRKKGGLTILPPSIEPQGGYNDTGKIEALRGIVDYIKKCDSKYVLITDANVIANINFAELLNFHIEKNAYMTAVYKSEVFDPSRFKNNTFLRVDDDGRITDVVVNQDIQLHSDMLIGMYLIERELLEFLICQCTAHNKLNFERDIIQDMFKDLDIYGFCFDGYVEKIDSIESFYNVNMELLKPDIRRALFEESSVFTKIRDEVPCLYGAGATINNSLIADGCIIEGSVTNSIIFRSVKVGARAVIKNSIIMQDSEISEGAVLNYCIADKLVRVAEGRTIIGAPTYPIVLSKDIQV